MRHRLSPALAGRTAHRLGLAAAIAIAASAMLALPTQAQAPRSSEYPSRISPPVYFPQLLPHWQAGPMLDRELYYTEPTEFAPDDMVAFQRQMLRSDDPTLRARTATELARSNNRNARRDLRTALATESDPHIRATMLNSLVALGDDGAGTMAKTNLDHADYRVRAAAARLTAIQQTGDMAALLKQAKAEKHPPTAQIMWTLLAEHADSVSMSDWRKMAKGPAPLNAIAAGAVAAHSQGRSASYLQDLAAADDFAVRQQLALRLSPEWPADALTPTLETLSQDSHVAVRRAVAETLTRMQPAGTLQVAVRLSQDSDSEVRLIASRALAHYADADAFDALVVRLSDADSRRVREQAEDSLAALQSIYDVAGSLAITFTGESVETRYHGYRLARRLHTTPYGDVLTERLSAELGDPRLASTLIETLGALDHKPAGDPIIAQATHESPDVRAAVALAIGRLGRIDQQQQLIDFVTAEADAQTSAVRHAALHAMGLLPSGDFSETLLWVLKQTRMENNPIDGGARATAMWSIGRLDAPSKPLLKRCWEQLTKPVIPTPMGPIYEDDSVRVSAAYAMVEQARRQEGDHEAEVEARKFLAILGAPEPTGEGGGGGEPMPTSETLREYAYQGEAYLQGDETELHEPQPNSYTFNFRPYVERNTN